MTNECPNSRGFWRRNSIDGLRMMTCHFEPAATPEEFEDRKANAAELKALEAEEARVQARYHRMLSRAGR